MPQFVILRHETPETSSPPSHWDLLLEHRATLKTWSFTDWPKPGSTVSAELKPDHRRIYLTYEGELTGNRGSVARVAWGQFRWIRCDDIKAQCEVISFESADESVDSWQSHRISLQCAEDNRWEMRVIPFGVR